MTDAPSELRTARLLLRPFRPDDVEDVFAYARDPEWGRFLAVPAPYTRRHAEEFVARLTLTPPEENLRWAVVHEGRVSGLVDLTPSAPGCPNWATPLPDRSGARGS